MVTPCSIELPGAARKAGGAGREAIRPPREGPVPRRLYEEMIMAVYVVPEGASTPGPEDERMTAREWRQRAAWMGAER
jgi:hypothetical protein